MLKIFYTMVRGIVCRDFMVRQNVFLWILVRKLKKVGNHCSRPTVNCNLLMFFVYISAKISGIKAECSFYCHLCQQVFFRKDLFFPHLRKIHNIQSMEEFHEKNSKLKSPKSRNSSDTKSIEEVNEKNSKLKSLKSKNSTDTNSIEEVHEKNSKLKSPKLMILTDTNSMEEILEKNSKLKNLQPIILTVEPR